MKTFFLLLMICSASFAFADEENYTCELQANRWFNGENLGQSFSKPMTYEECVSKGEVLFNKRVSTGTSLIHVKKNKITERTWTTLYKRVKITYHAEDGSTEKLILKRDDVEKGPVTKRTYDIKSGWRCWTQANDCEEI